MDQSRALNFAQRSVGTVDGRLPVLENVVKMIRVPVAEALLAQVREQHVLAEYRQVLVEVVEYEPLCWAGNRPHHG